MLDNTSSSAKAVYAAAWTSRFQIVGTNMQGRGSKSVSVVVSGQFCLIVRFERFEKPLYVKDAPLGFIIYVINFNYN